MEELTDAMITVMKTVNDFVEKNTPYNVIETLTMKELSGKLEDYLVDEAFYELLNRGILKSDVEPIVFNNGLMYRPVTGISNYGKELIAKLELIN